MGVFDINSEHSLYTGTTGSSPFTGGTGSPRFVSLGGTILIPYSSKLGTTRMRVILREVCCGSNGGPLNGPDDSFNWGESKIII